MFFFLLGKKKWRTTSRIFFCIEILGEEMCIVEYNMFFFLAVQTQFYKNIFDKTISLFSSFRNDKGSVPPNHCTVSPLTWKGEASQDPSNRSKVKDLKS